METIAIVGAGIAGLGIGWQLAKRGFDVQIFESGQAGRQASWAAAGMLSQQIELRPGYETLMPLLRESAILWPAFAEELEADSSMTIGYSRCGTLVPALTADEYNQLRHNYDYLQSLRPRLEVNWIDGPTMRSMVPLLSRKVLGGLHSTRDHQVENRRVVMALLEAFYRAGGTLHEHTAVEKVLVTDNRCHGISSGGKQFHAAKTILAAGAWSRTIAGIPETQRPPVRPVKGQMLALAIPASCQPLSQVITSTKTYLAPKGDRLIVGATVEEEGFDVSVTSGGMMDLLFGAYQILPATREWRVLETWAGLRPGTYDNEPVLGNSGIMDLTYATGHYRNGILLAPITAKGIADYICSGTLCEPLNHYTMERFQ